MIDLSGIDYHALDRLGMNNYLFYPRPDYGAPSVPVAPGVNAEDVLIPIDENVVIGATFHTKQKDWPNVLFFHGNGGIVADFSEVAALFLGAGLNFLPVDYRGYGHSSGTPSITNMMRDSHAVFAYARNWLGAHGFSGPIIVMGRSLGSAAALELIASYGDQIKGVIIESGFAITQTLLEHFGVNMVAVGLTEEQGFRNLDKMRTFGRPTLIIHGEFDHLLPYGEGQALFHACPAPDKVLLKVPKADHNDLFCMGRKVYMGAVKELIAKVASLR